MAFKTAERRKEYEAAYFANDNGEAMAAYKRRWADIRAGERSGRLTLLHRPGGRSLWCVCDCGQFKSIVSSNFRKARSCGCLLDEELEERTFNNQITALLTIYTRNAQSRNRSFELSRDQFTQLILSDCYYCGAPPGTFIRTKRDKRLGRPGLAYNGIDRESQDIGYTTTNVRPCCSICNYAKGKMSASAYFDLCIRVAKRANSPRSIFD